MMTTMRRLDHHFGVLVVALLQSDFGLIQREDGNSVGCNKYYQKHCFLRKMRYKMKSSLH